MKFVIIGGSGLVGSRLVERVKEHGHEVVAASPETGVNTLTGEGLPGALEGASVVVDVSDSSSLEGATAMEFFTTSTRNLLAAAVSAGVKHHLVLSVVGTERLSDAGYLGAKRAQEELIVRSSIPYSIVRATQFFEFIGRIADAATVGDIVRLAPALIQPMAADDVAATLRRIAGGAPVNGSVELGGPERFRLDDFIRHGLSERHDSRTVITDDGARYFGAKLSEFTLIPGPHAVLGTTRFATWMRGAERRAVV